MTNNLISLGMLAVVSGLAGFAVWGIEVIARRKERSRAAITDREHRNSLARVLGGERRELSERVKRDMAQRGHSARPFHFPAESQAREKPAGRLDRDSGYGETTRLSLAPKDAA